MWNEIMTKYKALIGKIKLIVNSELLLLIIIILASTLSFGLGRLSAINKSPVLVNQPSKEVLSSKNISINKDLASIPSTLTKSERVVASKNSDKYHFLTCPGAKSISETNKIYFNSEEEAQKAGYTRALNCK
ncbi:hypothetical protein IT397_03365 [Candidatus Nomurabacteria bacterium]|nr:hypothetical protein [Candidatus Nomurabacteria bacterium]